MAQQRTTILDDPAVRTALRKAWADSQPGVASRHEEGGFILQDSQGSLSVVHWPKGAQNSIVLPPHLNCKIGDNDIVATFHIHPNTGCDYLQEPSETNKRAVRDDPNLKGEYYVGEFVIALEKIYLIAPNGQVSEVGNIQSLLAEE